MGRARNSAFSFLSMIERGEAFHHTLETLAAIAEGWRSASRICFREDGGEETGRREPIFFYRPRFGVERPCGRKHTLGPSATLERLVLGHCPNSV